VKFFWGFLEEDKFVSFRDRYGILSEKRLSGVAGLKYIRLYGKSQTKILSPMCGTAPRSNRNELRSEDAKLCLVTEAKLRESCI
jgi:hypothetical protein